MFDNEGEGVGNYFPSFARMTNLKLTMVMSIPIFGQTDQDLKASDLSLMLVYY